MTARTARFIGPVRRLPRGARQRVGRVRARWREGLLAGRAQPRWWPQRVVGWPGLRSPHAGKEVVVFAGGHRYAFAPAALRGCSGHVHPGNRRPTTRDIADSLARLGLPTDCARTMSTVSSFEGGYDAIQTYDSAKFSWGFIQFSAPGGLFYVLAEIKASYPDVFEAIFVPAGIDAADWRVQVRRDGRTFVGRRAHDLLHDDPKLWTPFIAAAANPDVRDAQIKVAYERYLAPMLGARSLHADVGPTFGELFAESEIARTLLFDRAVRKGPAATVALFRDVVTRCDVRKREVDAIIDALLHAEAYDVVRLRSIVDRLSAVETEHH